MSWRESASTLMMMSQWKGGNVLRCQYLSRCIVKNNGKLCFDRCRFSRPLDTLPTLPSQARNSRNMKLTHHRNYADFLYANHKGQAQSSMFMLTRALQTFNLRSTNGCSRKSRVTWSQTKTIKVADERIYEK